MSTLGRVSDSLLALEGEVKALKVAVVARLGALEAAVARLQPLPITLQNSYPAGLEVAAGSGGEETELPDPHYGYDLGGND